MFFGEIVPEKALSYKVSNIFNVIGVGELVDGLEGLEAIADVDQFPNIGGLSEGVAGDVEEAFWEEPFEVVEGEGIEACAGWVDDDGVGVFVECGEDFAHITLMQSHVGEPVAFQVFGGVEDRFGAQVDGDDVAGLAGGRHPNCAGATVEIVNEGRGRDEGNGGVVEEFGRERIGLEKGGGANFEGEGLSLNRKFFDDVIGAKEVHFEELSGPPLFGLVNAEENGRGFAGEDRANGFYQPIDLGACEGKVGVARYVKDRHLLARAKGVAQGQVTEGTGVVVNVIGLQARGLPPAPHLPQRLGKPSWTQMTFGYIEHVGLGLGDHQSQKAHSRPIFGKRELHLVAVAKQGGTGQNRLWIHAKRFFNPLFLVLELRRVVHLLPAAPSAHAGVSAARLYPLIGRLHHIKQATLLRGTPFFPPFDLHQISRHRMGNLHLFARRKKSRTVALWRKITYCNLKLFHGEPV